MDCLVKQQVPCYSCRTLVTNDVNNVTFRSTHIHQYGYTDRPRVSIDKSTYVVCDVCVECFSLELFKNGVHYECIFCKNVKSHHCRHRRINMTIDDFATIAQQPVLEHRTLCDNCQYVRQYNIDNGIK
jgi:hypothetical protein